MKSRITHSIDTSNGYLSDVPTRVLLEELRYQGARFARAEVDLIRDGLEDDARALSKAALTAGVGGVLLHVSLIGLAASGIALLSFVVPVWAAALIVTGVYALVGGLVTAVARARMKAVRAQRTLNELKEDKQWFSQTIHDMKVRRHVSV